MRCVAGTFLGPQRAMVVLVNVPFSTETCNCNIIAPLSEQSYAHPASMYWYPECVEIKQFPKANAYSCYFNVVISKKGLRIFAITPSSLISTRIPIYFHVIPIHTKLTLEWIANLMK